MNGFKVLTSLAVLAALSSPASALTAVCKNPAGRIAGIHGNAFGGKAFDEADGISQATFTLIWKPGEKHAQLVSESSGGKNPETTKPTLIFESAEQQTFVVLYESAVWLYSLYPGPKILILTSHNNGASTDSGGAVVKSFIAKCELGT